MKHFAWRLEEAVMKKVRSVGFLIPLFLICLNSMESSAGVCPATGDELI